MPWKFNVFSGTLDYYRTGSVITPPDDDGCNLLLQTGDALLLQNGDNLLLQGCPEAEDFFLLLQNGDYLLKQDGDKIVV